MNDNSINQWTECPRGMLRDVVKQTSAGNHASLLRMSGAIAGLVMCAALVGWTITNHQIDEPPTPTPTQTEPVFALHCKDVKPLLGDYHVGKLKCGRSHLVAEHLAKCTRCSQYYRDNYPVESVSFSDIDIQLVKSGSFSDNRIQLAQSAWTND